MTHTPSNPTAENYRGGCDYRFRIPELAVMGQDGRILTTAFKSDSDYNNKFALKVYQRFHF